MYIPYLFNNGKFGFLNSKTASYFNREYDKIDFFQKDGWYRADKDGQKFYVDIEGKEMRLTHVYDLIFPFKNGIAEVVRDGYSYFINKNGLEVSLRPYKGYHHFYHDKYIIVVGISTSPDRYFEGLIDRTGFEVISPCQNFGFIFCSNGNIIFNDTMIDSNGNRVTDNIYWDIKKFQNGKAVAMERETGNYFIINENLEKVIDIVGCQAISGFENFRAAIKINGKWGMIDTDGKLICECIYNGIYEFYFEYSKVGREINDHIYYNLVDGSGREIFDDFALQINILGDYYFSILKGKSWGVVDKYGNKILDYEYSYIKEYKDNIFVIGMGGYDENFVGYYGCVNTKNEILLPPIYTDVVILNNKRIIVKINNKWKVFNSDKKQFVTTDYGFDDFLQSNGKYHLVKKLEDQFLINDDCKELREKKSELSF